MSKTIGPLYKYWRANFTGAKERGEAVSGAITLALSTAIALVSWFGVGSTGWAKTVANWDATPWIGGASFAISVFLLLAWIPFKRHTTVEEDFKGRLDSISRQVSALTERRLSIRCEDGGIASTVSHDATVKVPKTILLDGTVTAWQSAPISLFGCAVRNVAANTVKNCRAAVVSIEKDGAVLPISKGWLAFEAPNRGDDLESVDVQNGSEQNFCVCSVTASNEVKIGTNGFKWRKGSIQEHFKMTGDYVFWVELSGDEMKTQVERFVFSWRGSRLGCHLRYEPLQPA